MADGLNPLAGLSGYDFSGMIQNKLEPDDKKIEAKKKELQRNEQAKNIFETTVKKMVQELGDYLNPLMPNILSNVSIADLVATSSDSTTVTATAIASATLGSYSIAITALGTAAIAMSTISFNQAAQNTAFGVTTTFILNGTTINVVPTDRPIDICSKINSATYVAGAGVSAAIVANKIQIMTLTNGSSAFIYGTISPGWVNATDDPGSFLRTSLGLILAGNAGLADQVNGTTLAATVNGQPITYTSNTIPGSSGINGITLNLLRTTVSPVTITVNYNYDQSYSKINELLTNIDDNVKVLNDLLERRAPKGDGRQSPLFESDTRGSLVQLKSALMDPFRMSINAGTQNWTDGTLTTVGATAVNSSTLAIHGSTLANNSLFYSGDRFTIAGNTDSSGHLYAYTLTTNATITAGATTLTFTPQLQAGIAAGTVVQVEMISPSSFGIQAQSSSSLNAGAKLLTMDYDTFMQGALASPARFIKYFVGIDLVQVASYTGIRLWASQGLIVQLYAKLLKFEVMTGGGLWQSKLYGLGNMANIKNMPIVAQQINVLNNKSKDYKAEIKRLTDARNKKERELKAQTGKAEAKISGIASRANSAAAMFQNGN